MLGIGGIQDFSRETASTQYLSSLMPGLDATGKSEGRLSINAQDSMYRAPCSNLLACSRYRNAKVGSELQVKSGPPFRLQISSRAKYNNAVRRRYAACTLRLCIQPPDWRVPAKSRLADGCCGQRLQAPLVRCARPPEPRGGVRQAAG